MRVSSVFYKNDYPLNTTVSLEILKEVWELMYNYPLQIWDELSVGEDFLSYVKAELIQFHNELKTGTIDFYDETDVDDLIQYYSKQYNQILSTSQMKLYACQLNELNNKFNYVLNLILDDKLRNYVNTSVRDARLKFIGETSDDFDPDFFKKILSLQMGNEMVDKIVSTRLFPRNFDIYAVNFLRTLPEIPVEFSRTIFNKSKREIENEVKKTLKLYRDIGGSIENFFKYSLMKELSKHDEVPFLIPVNVCDDENIPKIEKFDLNASEDFLNQFYKFVIAVLRLKREIDRPMTTFFERILEINRYIDIFKYDLTTSTE